MLKIIDLSVSAENKEILKGLNLEINDGEIHVLMGVNGAGKSTVCKSILHHPSYEITKGKMIYNGIDITKESTDSIARQGIYYINQSPVEVEGITNAELLRTALMEKGEKVNIFSFQKECNQICEKLDIPKSFLHRHVNRGMSGGERKKNELFGMWILKPSLVLLDEIDSGLDVDALKIVGENLRRYQEESNASFLVITHQQKLIDELKPDFVHVMSDGVIVDSGDISFAKEIEKNGFVKYSKTNVIIGEEKNE